MKFNFGYIPGSGFYLNRNGNQPRNLRRKRFQSSGQESSVLPVVSAASVPVLAMAYKRNKRLKKGLKGLKRKRPRKRVSGRVSRVSKTVAKLSKKVSSLSSHVNQALSVLIHRELTSQRISPAADQGYSGSLVCTKSQIETGMAQAKFYDPTTPGTLITADLSTGLYARDITCKGSIRRIIRNNSSQPVYVDVYVFKCKDDSGTAVGAAWDAGLTDCSNGTSALWSMRSPFDSDLVPSLWSQAKKVSKFLQPGQQITVGHSTPTFKYNPANKDVDTDEYQRSFYTCEVFVVARSCVSHGDAFANLIGPANDFAIDIMTFRQHKYWYNSGGPRTKYIYNVDSTSAFTDPVVSNKAAASIQTLLV